jgi:hypothetical protein
LQTFGDNHRIGQTLSVIFSERIFLSAIVWCDRLCNLSRLLRIFTEFRRILPTVAVRAQASSVIIGEFSLWRHRQVRFSQIIKDKMNTPNVGAKSVVVGPLFFTGSTY